MSLGLYNKWKFDDDSIKQSYLYKTLFSALYGGVIGDALGLPYEFKKRGTFNADTMIGHGTHNQPIGTWSDDTSMTLCLIETLIEKGNEDVLMNKFLKYFENGYLTPYDHAFDIGNTTRKAILKYREGLKANMCGSTDENSNGNGSLMRIAPIAFLLSDNFNFLHLVQLVKQYSEITHAHPRSILACIIYTEILFRLIHGDDLEYALEKTIELCLKYLKGGIYEKEFNKFERIFNGNLKNIDLGSIYSDNYTVHSLEASLWSCLNSDNFKDAVLKAVNLGDDTDTIGSITGTIAGLQYCFESDLPNEWLELVKSKSIIDNLINKFCKFLLSITT